ncbi:hypothetical protein BV898_10052 [Hypsibius exemplaris]|uniref:Fibronectin type-III domain-containing protein n=1 Tax=Hypsibius exemplaris TaxID=2072580 RepID=A0A1W0WKR2_HYPEX|nr:hypothetical protein BV898_10052 [Hypsibius exemplaris]
MSAAIVQWASLTTVLLLAIQYGTVRGCDVVKDLKVTDITANKASLTWTADAPCIFLDVALMYEVDLRQTKGKIWTNSSAIVKPEFTLTGLLPNEAYTVSVMPHCDSHPGPTDSCYRSEQRTPVVSFTTKAK